MKKRSVVVAATAVAIFASPANSNLVVNGGFEQGTNPGSYTQVNPGDSNIAFWNVTGGNVDYIGTYWDGQGTGADRSIDLAGSALGTIAQTVTGLVANQWYTVSFYASRNPDGGTPTRTGTMMVGGTPYTFSYSAPSSKSNMNWQLFSYNFLATGTSTLLSFSADASAGCCWGPALDTVSLVAAVPEPEIWAMLLFGFGAIGWQMRRRRKLRAVTA